MAELRLYQYAIILQPVEDEKGNTTDPGKLLIEPTTVLASSPGNAQTIAARSIPDDNMGDLDRITVAVRPF